MQQLGGMVNVDVYRDSRLDADHIREFAIPRVVLATGSAWRRDGVGRWRQDPVPGSDRADVFTPDDILAGRVLHGPVVVFDDDHYYIGSLLAEKLRHDGLEVTLVTPAADVSTWTHATLEQGWIEERLHDMGVTVVEKHGLTRIGDGEVEIAHIRSDRRRILACGAVVLVTMRLSNDALYHELMASPDRLDDANIASVVRIGDCLAPSTIAAAVYAGHRYAREIDAPPGDGVAFKREFPIIERA
jgi:dimethylamine/trimethylamine dehydrogenase